MLPITDATRGAFPASVFLLLSRSAPRTGTGKSQFESAQKTTAVGANREIFGFDWGEAAEYTAILAGMVDRDFTGRGRAHLWSRARCHSPRRRGIQYAAAHRFRHDRLGVLDRPLSRAMTVSYVATTCILTDAKSPCPWPGGLRALSAHPPSVPRGRCGRHARRFFLPRSTSRASPDWRGSSPG